MAASYSDLLGFVQHLAPTWRKTQHVNLALLLAALFERPTLCLSDLARAYPSPTQPLHGRLKRLMRYLDNRNLDEAALFVRWMKLAYRFGEDPPEQDAGRPLLPLLLDTTYFEPFAMLIATVPCGSRGLPVGLTTYHRYDLRACFPPEKTWPHPNEEPSPPCPRSGHLAVRASAAPATFFSQNQIEEHLVDYVFSLVSSALNGVLVADRGFARASLFQRLQAQQHDFDIRIDAETHIRLPAPLAPNRPAQGEPAVVLGLRPGQRLWCPEAWYGKEDQVPIRLMALWDVGQKEPWYLASTLKRPEHVETFYRWRMRLELANRDEKTGVLLREGGDKHALDSLLHMHRLLLALATAEWLCALTGLQAIRDLPAPRYESSNPPPDGRCPSENSPAVRSHPVSANLPASIVPTSSPVETSTPQMASGLPQLDKADRGDQTATPDNRPACEPSFVEKGPASPPAVLPHRGETPKLPEYMRRFAARGHLSYVRLGLEVLRSGDLLDILRRMTRWLSDYMSPWTPRWRSYQIRYRLKHWWIDSS